MVTPGFTLIGNIQVPFQDTLELLHLSGTAEFAGNDTGNPNKEGFGCFFQGEIISFKEYNGTFLFGTLIPDELDQDLPVPGKVSGVNNNTSGVNFIQVIHSLEYMPVPDYLKTQRFDVCRNKAENFIRPKDEH
jgi:hypothetical protein